MVKFLKASSTLLSNPPAPAPPPNSSSRRKQQHEQLPVNISSETKDNNRSTFHNSLSSYHINTKQTRKNNPNSNQMQTMHHRKTHKKIPILSSLFKKKKNKNQKQNNLLSPLTKTTTASSNTGTTSHQLQEHELTQASLVTLGTIELNSYEDGRNIDYYYDDDDDFYEDNNHGLSSCGSAMRLSTPPEEEEEIDYSNDGRPQEEQIKEKDDENEEDNHSSFVTAHSTALSSSSSSSDFDHSSFQSIEKDDENVLNCNNTSNSNIKATTITNSSLSKPSYNHSHNNKQNDNFENNYYVHLAHEHKKIATLFQLGKECYNNSSYEDALQIQKEALTIVLYHISTQKNSHPNNHDNHNYTQDQIHLFQRQAAMIQYEIAKSEFVVYKEKYYYTQQPSTTSTISSLQSSTPTCLQSSWDDKQLSRLFDKMQNAKCVVSFQELAFYKNQLHQLDQRQEQQQQSNDCIILSTERIDILNAIAKIYFKNLHQYELALDYYNQVLELEFAVFTSLSEFKQELNETNGVETHDNHNVDSTNLGDEIREWKIKIQQTKKKIGAIYYLNGRFDMALLSSFSFHSSTTRTGTTGFKLP